MTSIIFPSYSSAAAFLFLAVMFKGNSGATFTLINRCDYVIWPGILSNAGTPPLETTGFELPSGGSRSIQAQPNWAGRFWARTGCTFDSTTGQGSCLTGDCGSNQIECNGAGAIPPATLAEFFIGSGTPDFYDVSLVDGYNLPVTVEASGGSGACGSTGCVSDLNLMCPKELRVGNGQACKSACEAFGNPEYCCSGAFGSPDTCKPSIYSQTFKSACPRAYSYAYDDATSTFTCTAADYTITFCPSLTSRKSSTDPSPLPTGSWPMTGPAVATGAASGSGVIGGSSEGSQDKSSNPYGWPWLPSFITADSPRTDHIFALHFTLIITLFTLHQLLY